MTAKSQAAWKGISAARTRLLTIASGLRSYPQIIQEVAEKVGARVEKIASAILERHEDTGAALGSLQVDTSGGLVLETSLRYAVFHTWWAFRKGMPRAVVKYASQLMAAELRKAIGAEDVRSPAVLAADEVIAEAAEAVRSKLATKARRDAERAAARAAKPPRTRKPRKAKS